MPVTPTPWKLSLCGKRIQAYHNHREYDIFQIHAAFNENGEEDESVRAGNAYVATRAPQMMQVMEELYNEHANGKCLSPHIYEVVRNIVENMPHE